MWDFRITEEGRGYYEDLGEIGAIGRSHVGLSSFGDIVMAGAVLGVLKGRGWMSSDDLVKGMYSKYSIRLSGQRPRFLGQLDKVLGQMEALELIEIGRGPSWERQ